MQMTVNMRNSTASEVDAEDYAMDEPEGFDQRPTAGILRGRGFPSDPKPLMATGQVESSSETGP